MRQPTKDQLKDQLALAAEEIIRLRGDLDAYHHGVTGVVWGQPYKWGKPAENLALQRYLDGPWWRRWFR